MAYELESDATDAGGRHSISTRSGSANLEDVFDDPEHGEIGRDRLGVHFAWEGVLLLGAIALGYLLYSKYDDAVKGAGLKGLLVAIAVLGLLALASSMSLRVGAPNLAIGSVAVGSGLYYAANSDKGLLATALWPVLFALGLGLAMALLVVGFQVPGWAGTLVGALIAVAWIEYKFQSPVEVLGTFDPADRAYYLVGAFALLTVVAGLLGLIKPIRRGVGRFRPVGDPATRRGGLAATVTSFGLIGATVLAAVSGVITAAALGAADKEMTPSAGFDLTALAIGIALVGGTSAFGRRGGVFGTLLATALVVLLKTYGDLAGWDISGWVLAASVVATGLVVTRLVETFGRPLSIEEGPDDWSDVGIGATASTSWGSPATTSDGWAGLNSTPASTVTPASTTSWSTETDRWR